MAQAPTSPHDVLNALNLSLSADPAHLDHARQLLGTWQHAPGFYTYLVDVFTTREGIQHEVRLQAALQFKNGVERYWRRGALHAISPSEKEAIRPRLLQMVTEPNRVLAKTISVSVATVAKYDYGQEWNDLPTALLGAIEAGLAQADTIEGRTLVNRALRFLKASAKALAANRMPKGRANMMRFADILFSPLAEVHAKLLQRAVQDLQSTASTSQDDGVDTFESALLAMRTLRFLIMYGFKDPNLSGEPTNFYRSTLPALSQLLELRLSLLAAGHPCIHSPAFVTFTNHIIACGDLTRSLIGDKLGAFTAMGVAEQVRGIYIQVVEGAASDILANVHDDLRSRYPTRLVVQALLLIKAMLGDWDGSSAVPVSPEFVQQFAEVLITRMLPLRAEDLQKWEEDPEEWMNEEEQDRWEFDLRPCAEYVLKALLSAHREQLGPNMASLLQQVSTPQSMNDLLLKEAVYTAIGRSPSDLEQYIDFTSWLNGTLAPECAGTDSGYRIVRRRIAWLLGNWVGEDLAATSRTQIYALLIHLVGRNPSTDQAIRLTAARSLACCDTWDFDQAAFLPHLPAAIEEVVQLLSEVSEPDSMKRLNQTLGVIIDRVGAHIAPYSQQLALILEQLWHASQENHFQTSILVTLTKLVEALDDQSQALQQQACPIIRASVDPSNPSYVFLQEDGLELWQVLLRRSSNLSEEMLGLLPLLISLLATGTDILPRCLAIFESYLLLNAPVVVPPVVNGLFSSIQDLLEGLKLDAVKVILHALNTVYQTAPPASWAHALDASGCFAFYLTTINRSDVSALIVTKYLSSLARIILASPDTFHQLVAAAASRSGASADAILDTIITQYVDRLDNMSQGRQRKLAALALAYLVPTTSPTMLGRLSDFIALWSSVLAQTEETEQGDAELYHIPDDYQSDVEVDYTETLETQRRQALSSHDPISAQPLKATIGQKLAEAQQLNGGAEVFQQQWLSRVDPLLTEDLFARLDGRLAG
ncbi:hypothetical protein BMF94_5632 [Rhodotorula taiwanensis]|uniref:Importin N-terminal domain-containing protein n=1 Tax=Rhodotorula taiwanensis TaxID=741276 RepID=A0A2S5B3H2_9BASI|nr:hypothetical protein BMF94_5632 [Rhodotorula taiwanensis]